MQTAVKIGNSVGVIIPKDLRDQVGIKSGSKVVIDKKGDGITISPVKQKHAHGVNDKFMKMIDDFMNGHKDVLRELSKR